MKQITLTDGRVALVDDDDYERLSGYNWQPLLGAKGCVYARVKRGQRTILMHRLVLRAKRGQLVDHRNGNGLDNRKDNLRLATPSQNQGNKMARWGVSCYRGVVWHKGRKKWQAGIKIDGKTRYLGLFSSEENAARAYDAAALAYWGEFAALNFPS